MEYTLFQVLDSFDHTRDTPLSQVIVDPLNVTVTSGAVTSFVDVANGQTITATSPNSGAVFNYLMASVYHQWVNVGTPPASSTAWTTAGINYNTFHVAKTLMASTLPAGSYRMRVDMLDYQGLRPIDDASHTPPSSECSRAHKGYAIQLGAASDGSSLCASCQASALDELAVYTPIISAGVNGFSVPLFNLPADYAGQTVNF